MKSKVEYIKLMYPNNTTVTIEGDSKLIEQIIRKLNGEYSGVIIREEITEGWDTEQLKKLLKGRE